MTKRSTLNNLTDGGGYEDTQELMFLISQGEAYGGNNGDEGTPYPYYSEFSELTVAGTGIDANRIKYKNGTADHWWLRSCSTDSATIMRAVLPTGNLTTRTADNFHGIAPACCII